MLFLYRVRVARKLLFKEARKNGATFSLICEKDKDLHYCIKRNVVGGPSIVFNRYHCVNETTIRSNPSEVCQKIIGYDCNALYLWCFSLDQPVGQYIRRRAEKGFSPEYQARHMDMYDWMDYQAFKGGISIDHKQNTGREVNIGPYFVD